MTPFPKATITNKVVGSVPVYTANDIGEFVFFSDIPDRHNEKFRMWMTGQTVSGAIRDESKGVETLAYLDDWERWYNRVRMDKTTYWD